MPVDVENHCAHVAAKWLALNRWQRARGCASDFTAGVFRYYWRLCGGI